MSGMVKCGTCGKFYNKRHLTSHMRLAHAKKSSPNSTAKEEQKAMEEILQLFKRLSDEERKELQVRLRTMT